MPPTSSSSAPSHCPRRPYWYRNDDDQCSCCSQCGDAAKSANVSTPSGALNVSLNPLPSNGLCSAPASGRRLSYSNVWQKGGSVATHNFGFGTNFQLNPYLCEDPDGSIAIVLDGKSDCWFDPVGSGYVPRYGAKVALSHDAGASQFTLRDDTSGVAYTFNDHNQTAKPGGSLDSMAAPGSPPLTVVAYSPGGRVAETQQTYIDTSVTPNVTTTESVLTAFDSSSGQELATSITLRRKVDAGPYAVVQQARLQYFAAGDASGNPGDLKYFTVYRPEGTSLQPIETQCFRYHTGGGVPAGLIKYHLGPEATRRLLADPAGVSPETASDALWSKYADGHYTYDSQQRVVTSTLAAGTRTWSFAYTPSTNTYDYNHWFMKTVVTRPDGVAHTIYANHVQQVMLDHLGSPGWINYRKYDSLDAMETQHAHPSAVISYDASQPDLAVNLRTTAGLIEVKEYYTTTSGGGVTNYLKSESVKQGSTGTPVLQKTLEYARSTLGASMVTPVSKQTVYRDTAAAQPIVTSYAYTYFTGTLAVKQVVTTLPVVPSGQNGDGVSYTVTQVFDELSHPTWRKDERGFITYQKFLVATGAVAQSIQDVDMSRMAGVPGNPGWTTPAGGGLHLTSDYQSDELGRITQSLGPWHEANGAAVRTATWTVYHDAANEVWSGQGFASQSGGSQSAMTLVNPVSITRSDDDGRTTDQITAIRRSCTAAGEGSGTAEVQSAGPLSASDCFPQSTWVRWSQSIYDNAGDLVASRVYFQIPTQGEGVLNQNYNETRFAYDSLGRRNRVRSAGGTITKNTFDPRNLVLQTLVGTDDSVAVVNAAFPWQNPVNKFDVTGDGVVNNLDAYTLSAKLGQGHNAPLLLSNPPVSPNVPPPYYDVNGDGWLTSADAQAVIDYLRAYGPTSAGGIPGPGGAVQSPGFNMVVVSENEYDGGAAGGDGLVTKVTAYVDDTSANNRVTVFGYDFRGRRVFTDGEVDFYEEYTYDNLGQLVRTDRKNTTSGGLLVGRGETLFDDRGRAYRTLGYAVDPSTGAVGDALVGNTFFDGAGQVIEQRSAGAPDAWTRSQYDGLGRTTRTLVGYTDGAGDKVFEQHQPTYDEVSNVIATMSLARFHDDTTTVGPLTANTNSRPSYAAVWFDEVGRSIASAAYGTNGGAAFVRPPVAPVSTDTVLVSGVRYNERGEAFESTDPLGVVSHTEFDDAGRTLRTIQNYVPGSTATDANITVEMTYNADGRQASLTAVNASTGNQTTQYIYGVTLETSNIATNDLLREVVYPGDALDRVRYRYNRQGQTKEMTDQNGTVHAYSFDKLGRRLADEVVVLASGVDGAVRKLATNYEVRGLPEKLTSFDGAGGVVNEVKNAYNALGQLVTQSQSHAGAVGMGTPGVHYGYDLSAASGQFTKGARPASTTYPSSRVVSMNYGAAGGAGDKLSRSGGIQDGASAVVNYSYLGLGAFVTADLVQPQVKLDFTGTGSGDAKYPGFDRFNRTVDQRWIGYGASPGDRDRFQYGYDRNSNRLYRANLTARALGKPFDELYAYDRVNRLVDFKRGTLSSDNKSLTGTPTKAQTWALDQTGNWPRFTSQTDGVTEVDQTRVHNAVNEITALSAWFPTQYDHAGNMTRMPKPAEPTAGFAATYDAWNRLVKLRELDDCGCPAATVQENAYDAQTWRTVRKDYTAGSLTETRHFYYTAAWQAIEERLGSATTPERQHLWGLRYIDDLLLRDRDTDGNGTLDERLFPTQDANWNVTSLVNTSGATQERFAYEAYGTPTILDAAYALLSDSQFDWELLFLSYWRDDESGRYYSRYRNMHSLLGRWMERDRFARIIPMRTYIFLSNSPPNNLDPFGLASKGELEALLLFIASAAFPVVAGYGLDHLGTLRRRDLKDACLAHMMNQMATAGAAAWTGRIGSDVAFSSLEWSGLITDKKISALFAIIQEMANARIENRKSDWKDVLTKVLAPYLAQPFIDDDFLQQILSSIIENAAKSTLDVLTTTKCSVFTISKGAANFKSGGEGLDCTVLMCGEKMGRWAIVGTCEYRCTPWTSWGRTYACCCGTNANFTFSSNGKGDDVSVHGTNANFTTWNPNT